MPIYTIRGVGARYVISAGEQDLIICQDRALALRVAAAAAIEQPHAAALRLGEDVACRIAEAPVEESSWDHILLDGSA